MKRKPIGQFESVTKRSRNNVDDEIDADRRVVCFGCFADDTGTGRKWIMCSCMRWIHEDSIDNEDVDIEKKYVLPIVLVICVVLLTFLYLTKLYYSHFY